MLILEASLDFKRADAGIDQGGEMVRQVQILQAEQVSAPLDSCPSAVLEIEPVPAELSALTSIGASAGYHLADVALAAETDAQGSMDETFERNRGRGPYLSDLRQVQFPGEHNLGKPDLFKKPHLVHGPVVHLG
jgi:hypothetical protein